MACYAVATRSGVVNIKLFEAIKQRTEAHTGIKNLLAKSLKVDPTKIKVEVRPGLVVWSYNGTTLTLGSNGRVEYRSTSLTTKALDGIKAALDPMITRIGGIASGLVVADKVKKSKAVKRVISEDVDPRTLTRTLTVEL
jgi:hypothetical protein